MDYPDDQARTTRQHAGETLKDTANVPGLVALAVAVVALSVGLYELAPGGTAARGRGLGRPRAPVEQLIARSAVRTRRIVVRAIFLMFATVWGAAERGTGCAMGEYIGRASSRHPAGKVCP